MCVCESVADKAWGLAESTKEDTMCLSGDDRWEGQNVLCMIINTHTHTDCVVSNADNIEVLWYSIWFRDKEPLPRCCQTRLLSAVVVDVDATDTSVWVFFWQRSFSVGLV